ncbi:cytochrome C [Candidatus Poribacteria bacterium]|nr:cytochrome C [Candidatus Poribacteria bacterium]
MKEDSTSVKFEENKQTHSEFAKNIIPMSECHSCHISENIAPNHDAFFIKEHRILANKAGNNCNQCHQRGWCLDCHQGGDDGMSLANSNSSGNYKPKSHRSDFINIHPIKSLDNPQSCYRCHNNKFCTDCHDRFPKGSLRIKSHLMLGSNSQQYTAALGEHKIEVRRNLQSCQTCHPDGDVCIQCHSSGKTNPHPRNWKSGNFKNKIKEKICLKCHKSGTF